MAGATSGLTLKLLLGFLGLWIAVMAIALPLAALPDDTGGRVLVVFPPGLPADDRLLAIAAAEGQRSEEHTSELQSLMRISYAVFCLQKKKIKTRKTTT